MRQNRNDLPAHWQLSPLATVTSNNCTAGRDTLTAPSGLQTPLIKVLPSWTERPRHPPEDFSEHPKCPALRPDPQPCGQSVRDISLKGGDPAAGSPTATLL